MMNLIIRPALREDAGSMCRVHRAAVRAISTRVYDEEVLEVWACMTTEDMFREELKAPDFLGFIAEMEGTDVGFGVLDRDLIRSLYVHPLHQRKGIGTRILSMLEQTAGSRSMRTLSVHSALNAVPFYEANGYSVIRPGLCIFNQMVTMRCMDMEKLLTPTR